MKRKGASSSTNRNMNSNGVNVRVNKFHSLNSDNGVEIDR